MSDQLIIGGARRDALDGATFDVTGPATGTSVGTVARAGLADVDAALTIAAKAHDDGVWGGVNATERGRVLARVAALIAERSEELAHYEMIDAGHPIGDARWEAGAAAATFEFYAGAANKHHGAVIPVQD